MALKPIPDEAGLGGKPAFDRFHHSSPSGQGGYYGGHGGYNNYQPPVYHAPPPPTGHIYKHYSFSHSHGGGGNKGGGAALSALTLLSFLFFLNILQQCLKDQMMSMTPQVMVMSSAKEEPIQGKQAKIQAVQDDKTYTLIQGVGRAHDAKDISEEKKHENIHIPQAKSPSFVNAMGDGIGEIINEE